jgi:thiamine kinase-like enzyme
MQLERLERLARRHVPGKGAIAMDRLGSGLVNESYRVARDGRWYSLRIAAPRAAELGLDRGWECRVLERAVAAGLAPVVECCEPRRGILVLRWVDAQAWTPEQVRRPENIERIARLARRIHALPPLRGARTMSPAAWVAYYRRALDRRGTDADQPTGSACEAALLRLEAAARLDALASLPPVAPALCHSDLHPHNLVSGDHGLILLDWEYAHVSEPLWDLAGWIGNNDFTADSSRLLLTSYLERHSAPPEAARLQLLTWLYDYVCLLWSALYLKLRPDSAGAGISVRARLLAARLVGESGSSGLAGQVPAH